MDTLNINSKNNRKPLLVVLPLYILLLISVLLSGCGATKTANNSDESTTLASRSDPNNPKIDDGLLAHCNSINKAGVSLQLAAYFDPSSRNYISSYINTHISSIPAEIETNKDHYMQFFIWQEDIPNQPVTRPEPVEFYFLDLTTGEWVNRNSPATTLSKNAMETIIAQRPRDNLDVESFFNYFRLILTGVDLEYDALLIALYDGEDTAYESMNLLIPSFSADPNIYAVNHPSSTLQHLHPSLSIASLFLSETEYSNRNKSLCDGFF